MRLNGCECFAVKHVQFCPKYSHDCSITRHIRWWTRNIHGCAVLHSLILSLALQPSFYIHLLSHRIDQHWERLSTLITNKINLRLGMVFHISSRPFHRYCFPHIRPFVGFPACSLGYSFVRSVHCHNLEALHPQYIHCELRCWAPQSKCNEKHLNDLNKLVWHTIAYTQCTINTNQPNIDFNYPIENSSTFRKSTFN